MEKAPINWTNMLLFSLTPVLALTLVPMYGYFYGYDLYEWMVFILLMGFCGMSILRDITACGHIKPIRRILWLESYLLSGVPVHCRTTS